MQKKWDTDLKIESQSKVTRTDVLNWGYIFKNKLLLTWARWIAVLQEETVETDFPKRQLQELSEKEEAKKTASREAKFDCRWDALHSALQWSLKEQVLFCSCLFVELCSKLHVLEITEWTNCYECVCMCVPTSVHTTDKHGSILRIYCRCYCPGFPKTPQGALQKRLHK